LRLHHPRRASSAATAGGLMRPVRRGKPPIPPLRYCGAESTFQPLASSLNVACPGLSALSTPALLARHLSRWVLRALNIRLGASCASILA